MSSQHHSINVYERGQGLVSYALVLILVLALLACALIFLLSSGVIPIRCLIFGAALVTLLAAAARLVGHQLKVLAILLLTALNLFHPIENADPINIRRVVSQSAARYRAVCQRRGINIISTPDLPPAMGNSLFVQEIFDHLIGNAIKYMGENKANARITIDAVPTGAEIQYRVSDTGIGIPPEHLDHVFNWFFRIRHPGTYGFGIGLPLVRFMTARMGGRCGVERKPEQGSTFWFTLPADTPPE